MHKSLKVPTIIPNYHALVDSLGSYLSEENFLEKQDLTDLCSSQEERIRTLERQVQLYRSQILQGNNTINTLQEELADKGAILISLRRDRTKLRNEVFRLHTEKNQSKRAQKKLKFEIVNLASDTESD